MGTPNYLLGNTIGGNTYWPSIWTSRFLYKRYLNTFFFLEVFFSNFFLNNDIYIFTLGLKSTRTLKNLNNNIIKINNSILISKLWFLKINGILILLIQFIRSDAPMNNNGLQQKNNSLKLKQLSGYLDNRLFKKNYKFYIMDLNLSQIVGKYSVYEHRYHWFLLRSEQTNFYLITIFCKKLKIILKKQYNNYYLYNTCTLLSMLANIYLLDLIGSYRGWRHLIGLPLRGQRTWSNGKTTMRTNNILRKYKNWANNNLYRDAIKNNYFQIQACTLWKNQWGDDWKKKFNKG